MYIYRVRIIMYHKLYVHIKNIYIGSAAGGGGPAAADFIMISYFYIY
jgi:hypothetical protein